MNLRHTVDENIFLRGQYMFATFLPRTSGGLEFVEELWMKFRKVEAVCVFSERSPGLPRELAFLELYPVVALLWLGRAYFLHVMMFYLIFLAAFMDQGFKQEIFFMLPMS